MFHPLKLLALIFLFINLGNAEVELGEMESWGFNGVKSGEVSLMSEKKMKIKDLDYSGSGPAAWFMVGKDDDTYTEEFTNLDGVIIPDENGSCDRLGRYSGDDIILTLPAGMKFTDYDYLSIYCIRFSHNFGYVPIKKGITFPAPVTNTTVPVATAPVLALPVAATAPVAIATAAPVLVEQEEQEEPQDDTEDDLPAECEQEPERRNTGK